MAKDIKLDTAIYPLEAIVNASYCFIDKAYLSLSYQKNTSIIKLSVALKNKAGAKKYRDFKAKFLEELLYQTLRFSIAKENKKIREYIIGSALNSALLVSSNESSLDDIESGSGYKNDPLGIAVPWEEKYGKK